MSVEADELCALSGNEGMPCRGRMWVVQGWKNVLLGQHHPWVCRVARRTRLGVENWSWTQPNPRKPCNAHLSLCPCRGTWHWCACKSQLANNSWQSRSNCAKKGQKLKRDWSGASTKLLRHWHFLLSCSVQLSHATVWSPCKGKPVGQSITASATLQFVIYWST